MTVTRRGVADTTHACEIFNRFIERLQQRVAYADELLKGDKFDFATDERITINRHESPYPADLNEAKKLWRERLRFEYLQERLGKIDARKQAEVAAAKPQKSVPTVTEKKVDTKPKSEAEEITDTPTHPYHPNSRPFT